MPSIRAFSLVAAAAALAVVPVYFAFAQPTEPKPAPTGALKAQSQPGSDHAAQPQPGQPGPGADGRRGPYAQPGGPGGPGGGRAGDASGMPQSVKQSMNIMKRALGKLKDQASDATKKDENLKLVGDMQRGCLAAKALLPERQLSRAPDDAKKNELTTTYRKQLILMMEKLLKLETAIMDGKGDVADKLIDEIGALRDESHEKLGTRG